jgi:hypothetical protein
MYFSLIFIAKWQNSKIADRKAIKSIRFYVQSKVGTVDLGRMHLGRISISFLNSILAEGI